MNKERCIAYAHFFERYKDDFKDQRQEHERVEHVEISSCHAKLVQKTQNHESYGQQKKPAVYYQQMRIIRIIYKVLAIIIAIFLKTVVVYFLPIHSQTSQTVLPSKTNYLQYNYTLFMGNAK